MIQSVVRVEAVKRWVVWVSVGSGRCRVGQGPIKGGHEVSWQMAACACMRRTPWLHLDHLLEMPLDGTRSWQHPALRKGSSVPLAFCSASSMSHPSRLETWGGEGGEARP